MGSIFNKIGKILKFKFKYFFSRSVVLAEGVFLVDSNVQIINSRITIRKNARLIIGKGTVLKNVNIFVKKGTVTIGKGNFIDNGSLLKKTEIKVLDGTITLENRNRIQCDIKVRFGGNLFIGNSTNINFGTEIRVDDEVFIGDYNQISYSCVIWDTNTHNIYSDAKRRELTDKYYPIFGHEFEKPKTNPVKIGNDCWVGREVAILKGTEIGSSSIIGYRTILSNIKVPRNVTVFDKGNLEFVERKGNSVN